MSILRHRLHKKERNEGYVVAFFLRLLFLSNDL